MLSVSQFDPNRTLRAPRRELWYPPSNAMGRFNEAADPQMVLAARAECPRRAPRQRKMAWHPHLLGAARPRRRGDRMSAPGKLHDPAGGRPVRVRGTARLV